MSKTTLRKELESLERDQIIEVVMELYAARKEVRDYFEFYLNPDSDKLLEKFNKKLVTEMTRSKRRMSRCRISHVRKIIREFESYQPDIKTVYRLYCAAFHLIVEAVSAGLSLPDALYGGMDNLLVTLLDKADSNGDIISVLQSLDAVWSKATRKSKPYVEHLQQVASETVQALALEIKRPKTN